MTLLSYPQSNDAATQSDDKGGKQTRIPSQVHAAHEEVVVESAVSVRGRGSQRVRQADWQPEHLVVHGVGVVDLVSVGGPKKSKSLHAF